MTDKKINQKTRKARQKSLGTRKKAAPSVPAQSALSQEKRELFLDALYDGLSVTKALKASGLGRPIAYWLRDRDPEFKEAWERARLDGHAARCDLIEDTMLQRAIDGYVEVTTRGGKVVKAVKKFDNTVLIELARGHMPDKYRQNHKVKGELGLSDELVALIDKVQESETSSLDSMVVK